MDAGSMPSAAHESRVLLFVSTRKDAEVSQKLLGEAGLASFTCDSKASLAREIAQGAAAVLATDELVQGNNIDELVQVLDQQERWSDLPFILMLRGGAQSSQGTEALQRLGNVMILDRPSGVRSVLSAVQAAVRARKRQYETRNLIRVIREAEARARQAAQAKDDFLAALSHELRTPLTPVLLLATETASDPTLSPAMRDVLKSIAKNVDLEARLIDDLLDLTHITRGKLRIEKAPHDVVPVLRDAIENVRPEFERKQLRLAVDLSADSAVVSCDPTRLQQVFWNILRNAAKFTPSKGEITVTARILAEASQLQIRVVDTGIGMTPEELERVFDAFVQGDHARSVGTHQFGGLGLGLTISRTVVELHNGRIAAASAGRGKGSSFTVELPVQAQSAATHREVGGAPAVAPNKNTASLRILVVEDDPPSKIALARLLTNRDHHVRSAGSVAEARSLAREPFDLLISDIGLPDGTGYELLEHLRPTGDFVAVALTGYGMEDDVQRSRTAGFFTHLTKPIRAAEIDLVLRTVAEKIEATKRLQSVS